MATPINKNISIAKADIYLRPYGSTAGFTHVGDCESGSLAIATSPIKVKSNGKAGGVVFEDNSDIEVTLNVTFRDITAKNVAIAMGSSLQTVAAGTKTEAITLAEGESALLEGFNIDVTTFGTLVEDEDYYLDASTGLLTALVDISAVSITYTYETFEVAGIASGVSSKFEVLIEQGNKVFRIYQWSASPAQTYDLISAGNITTLPISGSCIVDSARPVDAVLGQTGKVKIKNKTV